MTALILQHCIKGCLSLGSTMQTSTVIALKHVIIWQTAKCSWQQACYTEMNRGRTH